MITPEYDPKTAQTIDGEVTGIAPIRPRQGMPEGICMTVETSRETIQVHLGPSWHLEKQDLTVAPKGKVEVNGSKIRPDGKPAMIPAEVRKGDEVLTLRDDTGFDSRPAEGRESTPRVLYASFNCGVQVNYCTAI